MMNNIKILIVVAIVSVAISSRAQTTYSGPIGIGPANVGSLRGIFDINSTGHIYLNSNTVSGAAQTLYLPGHIYISPYTSSSDVSYIQARRSDDSGTTHLRFRTTNNGSLTEAIHIEGNGNVGFATTSPNSRLELGSGNLAIQDNTTIRLRGGLNGDTGVGFFYDNVTSLDEVRITHSKDSYNRFITLGGYNIGTTTFNPQFKLNTKNGNVGIGTAPAADYKLAVNGKVWATEINISVTVPAPDYVFNDGYTLPSIESVRSYINANKHLPGVPSAKEMETNGIDVSEFNMTLLKKLEELTLYVIDLQQQIDEMKKAQ